MFISLLIIVACCDTLPVDSLLYQSLETFYKQQITTQLLEFQESKKLQWLRYLPTLGITYTLEGKPRPAISWSSNLLYTTHKEKSRNLLKQKVIRQHYVDIFHSERLKLQSLIQEYQFLNRELFFQHVFQP